jgi:hypothetical protein
MDLTELNNIGLRNLTVYIAYSVGYIIALKFLKEEYLFPIFFFGLFIIILGLNFATANHICKTPNHFNTFLNTLLPLVFILGLGKVFLIIFPGWLRIFSNTVGMGIAYEAYSDRFNNLRNDTKKQFQQASTATAAPTGGLPSTTPSTKSTIDPKNVSILLEVLEKPKKILNEIDIIGKTDIEIGNMYDNTLTLIHGQIFTPSMKEPIIEILKNKNKIGYGIWYILLGFITVMISTDSLVNSNCGLNN